MAKQKTRYVCRECGEASIKFMGQCPYCKAWNSLEEELILDEDAKKTNRYQGFAGSSSEVMDLSDVEEGEFARETTGIGEFDRTLGGGLVLGGVVLIGGDPGIGKSTLLLQAIANLSKKNRVLYVSGEESPSQIKMRALRLGLEIEGIRMYGEIELEKIRDRILAEKSKFVVIDSIQTLFSANLTSAPGTISQVKECAAQLNRLAKENGITMIMVCHVTKEGELAGPRALEHIVDTVLLFEGDKNHQFRMIRAVKNRYGSLNEVGIFSMEEGGLEEVDDPTGVFSTGGGKLPGSAIFVSQEGNRSILVEIQSLLDKTPLPNPIRRSIGLDGNRLQMLCAVIHKYVDLPIYEYNAFVSLIGGMKFSDVGIDLPAFLAMISSFQGKALPSDMASFGEIGLTGELRSVQGAEDRVREAARMGLKKVIVPKLKSGKLDSASSKYGITVVQCEGLGEAMKAAFGLS